MNWDWEVHWPTNQTTLAWISKYENQNYEGMLGSCSMKYSKQSRYTSSEYTSHASQIQAEY